MNLEIGNFQVKNVQFGQTSSYSEGTLTINKEEALSVVFQDDHITEADIVLAKPGDDVRIVPVKEAVEPRFRLSGGPTFPGVTRSFAAI
jgi:glycine reductase